MSASERPVERPSERPSERRGAARTAVVWEALAPVLASSDGLDVLDIGGGTGGFAVRGTLTVPLADLTGAADRPGHMGGIGPVDPWLARDLATAAARNPRTSWCVTATDQHGHAAFHGCARPEPKSHATRRKREKPGRPTAARDGPGFSFTREPRDGLKGPLRPA